MRIVRDRRWVNYLYTYFMHRLRQAQADSKIIKPLFKFSIKNM